MKSLVTFLVAAALLAAGAGQALARTHAQAATSVTVVMKDPGCHWFSTSAGLKTTLAVKGPARLVNYDEATLRIAGPTGVQKVAVGKRIVLAHGVYRITMVGQASDDNHLKLTVK